MADSRSPACQSRRPTKSNPDPWKRLRCSPIVNSRIRRRMSSSISVSSDRLTKGSTSCSRVRTLFQHLDLPRSHEDTKSHLYVLLSSCLRVFVADPDHGMGT